MLNLYCIFKSILRDVHCINAQPSHHRIYQVFLIDCTDTATIPHSSCSCPTLVLKYQLNSDF